MLVYFHHPRYQHAVSLFSTLTRPRLHLIILWFTDCMFECLFDWLSVLLGREGILEAQREGIEGGTTYTVPFPLNVNLDANCVSLDFYAHNSKNSDASKQRQRGTDIMYCDVREDKIVRIDTLRHTLEQPPWVKQHFSLWDYNLICPALEVIFLKS